MAPPRMCCNPVERSSMNIFIPTAFRCTPSARRCWGVMEGCFSTAPPSAMQTDRVRRLKVFLFCSVAAGFLATRQCQRGNVWDQTSSTSGRRARRYKLASRSDGLHWRQPSSTMSLAPRYSTTHESGIDILSRLGSSRGRKPSKRRPP